MEGKVVMLGKYTLLGRRDLSDFVVFPNLQEGLPDLEMPFQTRKKMALDFNK